MFKRRVLVTGASGLLGRHIVPILRHRYGLDRVVAISSRDANLLEHSSVVQVLKDSRPSVVMHLAGYSGGIGANRAFPADFYYRNTLLTALMFQAAADQGVERMVYPMGGCSYPANAASPIGENQLWCGYPQPDSAAYSTAKMMGTVASRAYREQYGLSSIVAVPGNVYGEYDNFRIDESHVIPAMIRRYWEAKLEGRHEILMWGTGCPKRDFVYAGDVALVMAELIEMEEVSGPINISSGVETSVRDLALLIAELVGFEGEIAWDTEKPDGQMVKIFDVEKLRALGLQCETSLRDGLTRTVEWVAKNYDARGDNIRL